MAASIIFQNTTKVDFGYAPVSVIEQFQRFRGSRATEQALRELLDRAKRRPNVFGFLPLRSGRRWFERLSNKNTHEVNTVLSELDSLRDAYRLVDRASVIELLLRTADDHEGESTPDCEEYSQLCADADGDGDVHNERASNGTADNDVGTTSEPQPGNESESTKLRFGDDEEEEEEEEDDDFMLTAGSDNEKATQTDLAVSTLSQPVITAGNVSNSSWNSNSERLPGAINAHSHSPLGSASNGASLSNQASSAAALLQQAASACVGSSPATSPNNSSPSALELLALLNNITSQRIAPQLLSHAAVNTYALKQQLEQNALLSFLLTQSTLMLSAPFLDLNSLATSGCSSSPPVATVANAASGSTLLRSGSKPGSGDDEEQILRAPASVSPAVSRAIVSSSTESRTQSASLYEDGSQPMGVGFISRFRVQSQHASSSTTTNKRKLTQPKPVSASFSSQQSAALNLSTKVESRDEILFSAEADGGRRPISSRTLKALKAKRLRNAVSSSVTNDAGSSVDYDTEISTKNQQIASSRMRFAQQDATVDDVKFAAVAPGSSISSRLSASPNASGSDAPPTSANGGSQKRRGAAAATADGERLRLFRCQVCSRSFYRKDHLRQHLTIHTTDKPIKCPVSDCSYSCGQRNSLNWHLRTKHPQAFSQLAVLKHSSLDSSAASNVIEPTAPLRD